MNSKKNKWPIDDFAKSEDVEKLIEDWARGGPIAIITAEEMNQHLAPGAVPFS
jgi:hypothetical protein